MSPRAAIPFSIPRRATFWLLVAGFAVLTTIAGASVWLVGVNRDFADEVSHTQEVQLQAATLLLLLRQAETGQRSFLLTQDRDYLAPMSEAEPRILPAFERLRALTLDNPRQQDELSRLEQLLEQRLALMRETVGRGLAGDWGGALELVRSDEGLRLSRGIAEGVGRMQDVEGRLLGQREAAFDQAGRWQLAITLIGAVLVLTLGAASVTLMSKRQRELEAAQVELRAANEGLEEAVAERTAELTEANEEIQRFAYVVSHDLRAPLVNIMGFTSELEAMRADVVAAAKAAQRPEQGEAAAAEVAAVEADFDEAISFIKLSSSKMDRLINAILKLSREGRRGFTPQRLDVTAMLTAIAATLKHQTEEAGAEIVLGPLPNLVSDRIALEQVFGNLLENAVKYLEDGRPGRIEVRGRERGRLVVYEVQDNGRGVDARDMDRIFDLFRRAGRQDRPGEGIGLAHVRTLVRRLGGRITCESSLGEGTTFTVALPKEWRGAERRSAA